MPDEFFTQNPPPPQRRGGNGRIAIMAALAAFLIGAGGAGFAAWNGWLSRLIPPHHATARVPLSAEAPSPAATATATATPEPIPSHSPDQAEQALAEESTLETHIAALEQRIAQLSLRAEAASGNAARAEGLLVAFAARRALDRGVPLGYLEDQLRLRFGDAQPHAVNTVIDAAKNPITVDRLIAGLDTLGNRLESHEGESAWARFRHELAGLFVIRHAQAPDPEPKSRLRRARVYLEAGQVENAVSEAQHLPGTAEWINQARHYGEARRALDQIESDALLDTHNLKTGEGRKVVQPSTLVPEVVATEGV